MLAIRDQSQVLDALLPLDDDDCPERSPSADCARRPPGRQRLAGDALDQTDRLIQSIVRKLALARPDADDVAQTVWLRLLEKLDAVRDPRALPGWIFTTARNEAINAIRRARKAALAADAYGELYADEAEAAEPDDAEERQQALREACSELSGLQYKVVTMLLTDPPPSYAEIGKRLDVPIGSIGPTRARALSQLRRSRPLTKLAAAK